MLIQTVAALRFLYGTTLGTSWSIEAIAYPKKPRKLPVVPGREDSHLHRTDPRRPQPSGFAAQRGLLMAPQRWEVQDVIRLHGDAYRRVHGPSMSTDQLRVMQAVETCISSSGLPR